MMFCEKNLKLDKLNNFNLQNPVLGGNSGDGG